MPMPAGEKSCERQAAAIKRKLKAAPPRPMKKPGVNRPVLSRATKRILAESNSRVLLLPKSNNEIIVMQFANQVLRQEAELGRAGRFLRGAVQLPWPAAAITGQVL